MFYFVFYKVIIVVVIHFWVPTQKIKKNTKNTYKKILGRNPKNNRSEKKMLERP